MCRRRPGRAFPYQERDISLSLLYRPLPVRADATTSAIDIICYVSYTHSNDTLSPSSRECHKVALDRRDSTARCANARRQIAGKYQR